MKTSHRYILALFFLCLLSTQALAQHLLDEYPAGKKLQTGLANSQFILLGESDHSVKQFNDLKDSLVIRLLSEEKPTILLFESGITDLFSPILSGQNTNPEPIQKCIYPVWNAKENTPLFSFLNAHIPKVFGIDIQPLGYRYSKLADSLFRNRNICTDFFRHDSLLVSLSLKKQRLQLKESDLGFPKDNLIAYYHDLILRLETNPALLGPALSPDNITLFIHTLQTRIALCREITITNARALVNFRDSLMFENLNWFVDHQPAGTRFVFWGHNNHVSKSNLHYPGFKFLGNYIQKVYPGKALAIGLLYYRKDKGLTAFLTRDKNVRKAFRGRSVNSLLLCAEEPESDPFTEPYRGVFDYVILFNQVGKATYQR
jgi:erythromycin esterase